MIFDTLTQPQQKEASLNAVNELLISLADMVGQHCRYKDGMLMDMGLSANADALDILERAGIVERVRPDKDWYRWTEEYRKFLTL